MCRQLFIFIFLFGHFSSFGKTVWQRLYRKSFRHIFTLGDNFIIQRRLYKLIDSIITIIKCGTWRPVKFQLVSCSWNEMIFYHISELMLPTLIRDTVKTHFSFDPVQKREILQAVKCHIFCHINTIYQFITSFLDKKNWLFLRNMEPLDRMII